MQTHEILLGFCNANYAEDACDLKSTSGYIFMLISGPIAWKSKKQASIALSTTEAEYYSPGGHVVASIVPRTTWDFGQTIAHLF